MKILIVEDNLVLSENIRDYLAVKNIESKQLFEWKNVLFELSSNNYDVVILDLWLPDINWKEVCDNIRNAWKDIPILVLTSRNSIDDKIKMFKSWIDDYLTKSFLFEELLIRLQALNKRNFTLKSNILKVDDLEIDIDKQKVFKWENEIILSHLEFKLLVFLLQNKWKIQTKETLLEKVWWEYDAFSQTRTLDIHIWYLRKKLWNGLIETVRWTWYLIN